MADIIKLLPDSVANQIAAGEVIQRPASAVKELLENAVDAGASQIKLIIKDAGKTLIQVVDNGKGMSPVDARMCFERHATSKIMLASDLFAIRTMGFRGEAIASIAAISRVEIKTRSNDDTIGTSVIVEGSVIESQNPCQCPAGANVSVKNLFYNTPARRNFLKSEQVEKNHVFNEMVKLVLSHPEIEFEYFVNHQLIAKYEKGNLKQRIVHVFGSSYQQKLVPVEEKTDILQINGFVCKPAFAKKKRGEQYFFVNQRYVRSPYFNHAVEQAFVELIPEDMYPSFFLFIEVDPGLIDVNVHPTKTEVKFQDERYAYQVIKSAVKRGLGKFNITPTLDFERETAFDNIVIDRSKPVSPPVVNINPDYNPFGHASGHFSMGLTSRVNPQQWEQLFPDKEGSADMQAGGAQPHVRPAEQEDYPALSKKFIHIKGRFIVVPVKSGLMIIDHQRAHERILYERFLSYLQRDQAPSQQLLFPETLILLQADADLLREMLPVVQAAGFEISDAGKGTFVVTAVPVDMTDHVPMQEIMEGIIDQLQMNKSDLKPDKHSVLAKSMAKRLALKHGKDLDEQEMMALTESLFTCAMPYSSPAGKPVVALWSIDEIAELFK